MTDAEQRLLAALAWMCQQYLGSDPDLAQSELDHCCMSAGEGAVELLVEYGLLTPVRRGGTWTEAGIALLDATT